MRCGFLECACFGDDIRTEYIRADIVQALVNALHAIADKCAYAYDSNAVFSRETAQAALAEYQEIKQ